MTVKSKSAPSAEALEAIGQTRMARAVEGCVDPALLSMIRAPLPSGEKECIALLAVAGARLETSRMVTSWFGGRVLTHLEQFGSIDATMQVVAAMWGYKDTRILYEMKKFYKAVSDDSLVLSLASHDVIWQDVRDAQKSLPEEKVIELYEEVIEDDEADRHTFQRRMKEMVEGKDAPEDNGTPDIPPDPGTDAGTPPSLDPEFGEILRILDALRADAERMAKMPKKIGDDCVEVTQRLLALSQLETEEPEDMTSAIAIALDQYCMEASAAIQRLIDTIAVVHAERHVGGDAYASALRYMAIHAKDGGVSVRIEPPPGGKHKLVFEPIRTGVVEEKD